jgi:hypothetical protein
MQFLRKTLLTLMVSLLGFSLTYAQADIRIIVGSATVGAPSTGNTFEVSITNVGSTASVPISGFSFGLSVPGASGITFTAATINTVLNGYLFAGETTPPFTTDSFPNQTFTASDFYAQNGGIVINPNQTFGLGLITFDVASNAANQTTVTLAAFPVTSVNDENFNEVAFTGFNGTISLSAVPEPATWAMIGVGSVTLSGWYYRRRQQLMKDAGKKVRRR